MNPERCRTAAECKPTPGTPRQSNDSRTETVTTVVSKVADLVTEAVQHHQAGRLKEAACYRQLLILQPSHAEALHQRGLIAFQVRRYGLAVELIRQALRHSPRHGVYWCNLGAALAEHGNFDEAIAAYRQAIGIKPDYAQAHSNLGMALARQGKLNEAQAALL
jgi:protein O-GlcNAc transferase